MIAVLLSFCGLLLIAIRMFRFSRRRDISFMEHMPRVSIVVPARNEEQNLPTLLTSLKDLQYPNFEIIVVDDQSEDLTAKVAESFGVKVIRGNDRASGWMGKQWACHQGASQASGDYVLFTDADTVHRKDSLQRAITFILETQSDLISALPWHSGNTLWETSLGLFHLILLTMTAPFSEPKIGRMYAIGQYLLFKKSYYDRIGGHASVKSEMVEDIPIAAKVLNSGGKYSVFTESNLFEVRMYDSYKDFLKGWARNFRAGIKYSHKTSFIEAVVMIAALTGSCSNQIAAWIITVVTWVLAYKILQRLGRFNVWSILLAPFAIMTFCLVTVVAITDEAFKRPFKWKNRSYPNRALT